MNDGLRPPDTAEKSLGDIVSDVSEKASLLVREEIELAKAEVREKVSKLTKGAGVGLAAGVILVFAFVMFLQALAWFINDLLDVTSALWAGFAIVTGILILVAAVAGLLARRWLRSGTPPTPELAIEEAKRTREELERQSIERDQLGRTLEKGEEVST
ncbi:MAG TPA: phage holin family protein [Thermoleophilaceae bacterium]|nr:phage holin family protein [Thermoleophilaceae bacterium]